jgi:hypothetical protein
MRQPEATVDSVARPPEIKALQAHEPELEKDGEFSYSPRPSSTRR